MESVIASEMVAIKKIRVPEIAVPETISIPKSTYDGLTNQINTKSDSVSQQSQESLEKALPENYNA
ncbi:MAG: hypothetical protein HC936_09195 [Leptolyngbyaceae cyanobacterium SU_3_3]|nr:hypothetical protein [Leptolyngbyaceae cyanobacterium SU_3_3]